MARFYLFTDHARTITHSCGAGGGKRPQTAVVFHVSQTEPDEGRIPCRQPAALPGETCNSQLCQPAKVTP